jgi:hypothetical protein
MLSAARSDAASTFEQPPSIGPLVPWGMPCIASRTGTPTPTCPRAGPTYPGAKRRGHAPLRDALCEAEQEHAFARRVGLGDPAAALRAAADGERARLMVVLVCTFDGSDGARPALSVAAALADRLGAVAFVAQVGRGSVGQLEARARTECPALIVAESCGAEGWHAALPGSGLVRLATSGSTPLLFVPPAYRHTAVASPRVARDAGRHAKPAKASPVSSAAPAQQVRA